MQIRSPAAISIPTPIRSRDNPQVKALRALISQPRVRRELRQCWLEGSRLVEAFLSQETAGWQAHLLVWAATAGKGAQGNHASPGPDTLQARLIAQAEAAGAEVLALDAAIFAYLSGVEAPQGIGLVVSQTGQVEEALPAGADILVLDGLQDPGNMGSMIRTAAAAGVGQVLLTEGSTEAFSPKALRAGAGTQFLLPVREGLSPEQLAQDLSAQGYTVAVTLPPGAPGVADLYSPEVTQRLKSAAPIAWVLGQEGQGVSPVWQGEVSQARQESQAGNVSKRVQRLPASPTFPLGQTLRITIRHDPQVESLNVTAAAAVVLFERLRCRR
nr:putative TrmH family tRNA/rRNA methyltransferase [Cupriavidus sp.]